jgi:hypothetical protein
MVLRYRGQPVWAYRCRSLSDPFSRPSYRLSCRRWYR